MTEIIGYPDYTINENGEIYNKKTGRLMKQKLIKGGYFQIGLMNNKIRTFLLVHRLLYQMFKLKSGEIMPENIDHKNRIKTDNSLDNLRSATSQENSRNREKNANTKSGHKDIDLTPYGRFRVQIRIGNGLKRYSKTFKILEEALEHRDIKLKEFHGKFANNGIQIVDETITGSTVSAEALNLV